ncbi:uncharacterized protein LOC103708795 [Phoenix dactylifera]|uniref:Uncharacterized protein LOC103708795 n=1 Tax=Phoenix dactylifera TaxID=42345 RepID=A0A8B7C597_PHODC|nr:uncharacterized protein LOC103708795 [Phoenix dactylifera]
MAFGLVLSFRPAVTRACATPGGDRRGRGRSGGGGGGNWWAPLFGWSSEPDYIDGGEEEGEAGEGKQRRPARRFTAFTEEKARELRMRTLETETFHDAMYHSAIASRLASDLPPRRSAD